MALFSRKNIIKQENKITLSHKVFGLEENLRIEYLLFEDHFKFEISSVGLSSVEYKCFIESKYIQTLINDLKRKRNSEFKNKINSSYLKLEYSHKGIININIVTNVDYDSFLIVNEKELNTIINFLENYI